MTKTTSCSISLELLTVFGFLLAWQWIAGRATTEKLDWTKTGYCLSEKFASYLSSPPQWKATSDQSIWIGSDHQFLKDAAASRSSFLRMLSSDFARKHVGVFSAE